jgi:hypothetical protein
VHQSGGVLVGPFAARERDVSELFGCGAELDHVPLGAQREHVARYL